MIKFTPHNLQKLENLLKEGGYKIRYEKGNFKSGYCILEELRVIVVNKFSSIDIKIGFLLEILKVVNINEQLLDDKLRSFYGELKQTEIKF